jgi:Fe-S-cluster containining protein
MKLGNKFPWYSGGLHFECLQCGHCCAGPEGGYIWVSRPEIRLIADFLKMPVKELKQKFMRRVGLRMTIIEDLHMRDCVFLQQTKQGRGCAIYEVRPAQCRNWPFWEHNLVSPGTWNLTGRKCPGINRGQYYSPEQIQAEKKNKKWWRPVLRSSPDEDRSSIQPGKTSSEGPNAGNGATAKDGSGKT